MCICAVTRPYDFVKIVDERCLKVLPPGAQMCNNAVPNARFEFREGGSDIYQRVDSRGSVGDDVAFFSDGLGQGFARLTAVDVNAIGGPVDADLGLRVELLHGGFDGALAVAAGHACDGEGLVHFGVPLCW
jgi:hypothetical protein